MATLTTTKLERKSLLVLTGRYKPDFHLTQLLLHGITNGMSTKVEIYDQVRVAWGTLSKKRLEALEQTRPREIKLDAKNQVSTEVIASWVERAKVYHRGMLTDWQLTALDTRGYKSEKEICGYADPTPVQGLGKARCEVCKKPRPTAEMKRRGGYEQVCRTCCKLLKQSGRC